MIPRELLKIDLNLLVSLQVLLEERNVSRAAERLFITQPAMSKTLGRLRYMFADPLFTRSSHGMLPTPRALEIADNLDGLLQNIHQLVSGGEFDPRAWRGELTIALSEYVGIWLLPALMARLQNDAPGLTLKSITRVENQLQQLAEGGLDLVIHIKHSHYGEDFLCKPIGSSPPVLLARQGHPLSRRTVSWEELSEYPLIRPYISDREELEVFQQQESLARLMEQPPHRGWFETAHLMTALEVLRHTDYLMPAQPFLLGNPEAAYNIQALAMPADLDYHIEYLMVRHRRTENSPIHNWLWRQILRLVDDLRHNARHE